MGKVLQFRRVKQEAKVKNHLVVETNELEDDIEAIMNDYSLTPANRRWILENMLMEIDEQLEGYKKELEQAERKLDTVVKAAEQEIAEAYSEFETHVQGMTKAVKKLTRTRRPKMDEAAVSSPIPDQK